MSISNNNNWKSAVSSQAPPRSVVSFRSAVSRQSGKSSAPSVAASFKSAVSRQSGKSSAPSVAASFKSAVSRQSGKSSVSTLRNKVKSLKKMFVRGTAAPPPPRNNKSSNLLRTVNNTDTVTVKLPMRAVEIVKINQVFRFTLDQMGIALANCLELRNRAISLHLTRPVQILDRYLKRIQQINASIEAQKVVWNSALKNRSSGIVSLPNHPVTPVYGYTMAHGLKYAQNRTAARLSPRTKIMLDRIGQGFARLRAEIDSLEQKINSQKLRNARMQSFLVNSAKPFPPKNLRNMTQKIPSKNLRNSAPQMSRVHAAWKKIGQMQAFKSMLPTLAPRFRRTML